MYDALVIGAGPAGATAARLLAKAGRSVAVVEKSSFPRRKVCGEFISATSLPLLHDSDVREEFLTQAGPEVRRVGLFAGDAALSAQMPAAGNSVAGWGRALGRDRLDLLLADAAARAGATLWQPWKMLGLQREAAGYLCTIAAASGEIKELRARLVLAANGSWERSPLLPDRARTHPASELLAFKAHFLDADLPRDLMPLLVFPGGYGGMVHSDNGRVSLSCCIRRDVLEQCRLEHRTRHAGDSVLQHIRATNAGVREALSRARLDGPWLAAGPIRPGIRRRYEDGIFYLGNIAGEAHPIIAEGISMAMQSAWLLCRRLVETDERMIASPAIAEIGRRYAADWKAAFSMRIRAASLLAHGAMWPKASRALPLVERFPAILTWGARLSGKTTQLVR
jgi:flavin-dependent dehydrogenase